MRPGRQSPPHKKLTLYCMGIVYGFSIYHTTEKYFSDAMIGQLGGDQPDTIHLRAVAEKQNGLCRYIVTNKLTLCAASYSACVVYTKTIIHLNVGESGRYLPSRESE